MIDFICYWYDTSKYTFIKYYINLHEKTNLRDYKNTILASEFT